MLHLNIKEKSEDKIVFQRKEDLECAWDAWSRGNNLMLSWDRDEGTISEIVDGSILNDITGGKVRIYSLEPK